MTKSESLSTLRTGLLALAYIFILVNIGQIFLDWNSGNHNLMNYVVLLLGGTLVLLVSWRNNLFGAISYILLLGYVYGYESMFQRGDVILNFSPVILLIVAWLVY